MSRARRGLSRLARHIPPALIFGIMAIVLVSPAWLDGQSRIIGGGELGGWLWRYWWMKLELVALGQTFPDAPLERVLHSLSLGRFPETGNVTDLLALSVPLDLLFGHPEHYNAKVVTILVTNALAGYVLAYSLCRRRWVSMLAALTFACNVFVVYEFQGSGLRQAILCFLALFVWALEGLLREKRFGVALLTGLTFAATAVFYWFYGLFAAMYAAIRFVAFLIESRWRPARSIWLPILASVAVAGVCILPFALPYVSSSFMDPNAQKLPEVTWLENFPALERLEAAPLRPDTPYDNLLSSLARVLYSSWAVDWVFNPLQSRPVPLVLGLLAVGMGLLRWRRTGFWLLIFVLFYSLTWGPYLQYGGEFVRIGGEYSVRLPYWYAFKFVPMMSRLFAPYRMGSMVILALMVLLTLNLASLSARLERHPWTRAVLGLLFVVLYFGQLYSDPLRMMGVGSNRLLPLTASQVSIPGWYHSLASEKGRLGIIELPMGRQQDLLNYYQMAHAKKVLGGWASPGALPPVLRFDRRPSKVTALLQWLSMPDGLGDNPMVLSLRGMGTSPYSLTSFPPESLEQVHAFGYRYVLLHELGCFLLEPRWGKELYQRMKVQLEGVLGKPVRELVELPPTTDERELLPFRSGMPWVPSIYSPLLIPEPRPLPLHMVIYRLKQEPSDKNPDSAVLGPTSEDDSPQEDVTPVLDSSSAAEQAEDALADPSHAQDIHGSVASPRVPVTPPPDAPTPTVVPSTPVPAPIDALDAAIQRQGGNKQGSKK